MTGRSRSIAAAGICAAVLAVAAPAQAVSRASCLAVVTGQLRELRKLSKVVRNDSQVSHADRISLTGRITRATVGITGLQGRIRRDGTAGAVNRDCRLVVTRYRIKPVLTTQVRIVLSADLRAASAQSLLNLAAVFQRRIDAAAARGRDTATAQADVRRLNNQATAVQTVAAALAARVLAVQPGRYPHNRSVLIAAGRSLADVSAQLATAQATSQVALQDVSRLG